MLAAESDGEAVVAPMQQVLGEVQPALGEETRAGQLVAVDQMRRRSLVADDAGEIPEQRPEASTVVDRPLMQRVIAVDREAVAVAHLGETGSHSAPVDQAAPSRIAPADERVLVCREARHEIQFLMHEAQTRLLGLRGVGRREIQPFKRASARIRPVHARQAFEQGRLARSILAEQRMHPPGPYLDRHALEHGIVEERLPQIPCLEEWRRLRHAATGLDARRRRGHDYLNSSWSNISRLYSE